MDLNRFLDLYIAETQEHVRQLHRSLLGLEHADRTASLEEAFRSAHTIKGLSAAMGYSAVADLAHRLEDQLDGIRAGRLQVDGDIVDALLADADALEASVATAVCTPPGQSFDPGSADAIGVVLRSGAAAPGSTETVARICLRPDAPIKSARAMLVMKALADLDGVLGTDPVEFDDAFDGVFRIFFSGAADLTAAESAIVAAGEVLSVQFGPPSAHQEGTATGIGSTDDQVEALSDPAGAVHAPPQRQLRVDAERLDNLAEGIAELSVLHARLGSSDDPMPALQEKVARMGTVLATLQHDVLALRMVPVRHAFERLPRVVRDAARVLGKDVELLMAGDDVELDRTIIEEIGDPLVHLLRNSVDHGIESEADRRAAGKRARGRIRVTAERERSSVRIVVEDDGGGIDGDRVQSKARAAGLLEDGHAELSDDELFRLLSHSGLSTAAEVTSVSGRGVGMDVVASRVRALGGAIEMQTTGGQGTRFSIRLPVTLALAAALRVRVGNEDYAIPLTHVAEAVDLGGQPQEGAAADILQLRNEKMPLVRMRRMLNVAGAGEERAAVIAEMGGRRAALAVDELIGREQILVKSFDAVAGMYPYFSGATMLADGRPALVLDPLSVI